MLLFSFCSPWSLFLLLCSTIFLPSVVLFEHFMILFFLLSQHMIYISFFTFLLVALEFAIYIYNYNWPFNKVGVRGRQSSPAPHSWKSAVGPPYPWFYICIFNHLWIVEYCSMYLFKKIWVYMDPHSSNPCCSYVNCNSSPLSSKKRNINHMLRKKKK